MTDTAKRHQRRASSDKCVPNTMPALHPRSHSLSSRAFALAEKPRFVKAHHAYFSTSTGPEVTLQFPKGAIIEVLHRADSGWWDGRYDNMRGWFPSEYVGRLEPVHSPDNPIRLRGESLDASDMTSDPLDRLYPVVSPFHTKDMDEVSLDQEDPCQKTLRFQESRRSIHSTTSQPAQGIVWKDQVEEVFLGISSLADACVSLSEANLQIRIFNVVSSIRVVLRSIDHAATSDELRQQKRAVLKALSTIVQNGKSHTNNKLDRNHLQALVNSLWVETLLLEELFWNDKNTPLSHEFNLQPQSWPIQQLFDHRDSINEIIGIGITTLDNYVTQKSQGQSSEAEFQTENDNCLEALKKSKEASNQAINSIALAIHGLPSQVQEMVGKACEEHRQPGIRWSTTSTVFSETLKHKPADEPAHLDRTEPNPPPKPTIVTQYNHPVHPTTDPNWKKNLVLSPEPISHPKDRLAIHFPTPMSGTLSTPIMKSQKGSVTHTKALSISNVEHMLNMTPSASSSTIDQAKKKTHRPRGLSVSSLRISLTHHTDSPAISTPLNTLSAESFRSRLSASLRLRRPNMDQADKIDHDTSKHRHSEEITISESRISLILRQQTYKDTQVILNSEGQILGATTRALVEIMTLHSTLPDTIFCRAFFFNFRLFMSPCTLVVLLVERFHLKSPKADATVVWTQEELLFWETRIIWVIRYRVFNVIKTWLEDFLDLEADLPARDLLMQFATVDLALSMPEHSEQLIELVTRKFDPQEQHPDYSPEIAHEHGRSSPEPDSPPTPPHNTSRKRKTSFLSTSILNTTDRPHSHSPTPNLARPLRNALRKALHTQSPLPSSTITLVHIDPHEVAKQLTLMENSLFCQIPLKEFLAPQESRKNIDLTVNIKTMIRRSTNLVYWISSTILDESDIKKRAQVIKYWIKVGDYCLHLSNYNTLMAIRCSLNSSGIARLKLTWEIVMRSTKHKTMLETTYRIADSQRNFANYRKCLKNATSPCLPFLGIYLSDMLFLDEGNPAYRVSHTKPHQQFVNFDKYIKLSRVLAEIKLFQVPYKLKPIEDVQRYLLHCLEMDIETDDSLIYSKSLAIEPKFIDPATTA
ncbi:ras guanine nucleotide exchange factor domain-containing protein [Phycomyces nitens]|nr:ras guanine nucleotide exchange factor domain-containing protein [Phycomyces nitens]